MFNFIKFINRVVAGEDPAVAAEQATQIQASEAGATTVASDAVGKDGLSILPLANAVDGGRAAAASPCLLSLAAAADATTIASDNHDMEAVENAPGEHQVPIAEQQPPIEKRTYALEEDLQYDINHQIELHLAVVADATTIASDNQDVEAVKNVPGEHQVPIAEQQPPIEDFPHDDDCNQPVLKLETGQQQKGHDVTVCSICGCTPCEWQQYGLNVISMMMQAFDHENRTPQGQLIDPATNLPVSNTIARKVAYKFFQYDKYGTVVVGKALQIPKCVIRKIRQLYP